LTIAGEDFAMKPEFLDNKDFWAGMALVVTGGLVVLIARDYAFGTMVRMGPGFFPTVLGALLVLFGFYVLAKGLRSAEKIEVGWSPRALLVLPLSLALFGFLVDRAGLVPALGALIVGSAAAGKDFKLVEIVLLTAFLIAFSVIVFVWALGRPFTLLVGH
jgi:Tripartite tricarboxylate transporter TctB family